jgi:hypothetical protein
MWEPVFGKDPAPGKTRESTMTHKIIAATAVIVGLFALGGQTALAAPMMCSGEKIPASRPAGEVRAP